MGRGQSPHSSVGTSWVEGEPVAPQPVPSVLTARFWGWPSRRLPSLLRPRFPPLLHFSPRHPHIQVSTETFTRGVGL